MKPGQDIEALISEFSPFIYRFFGSRVDNPQDREDLIQESCAALIEASPRFKGRAGLKTWVYSICNNTLKTYYYKKSRPAGSPLSLDAEPAVTDRYEEALLIGMVLEKLDEDSRRLYELYYQQDLSISEISQITGIKEGTLKYRLHLLRRRVRTQIM